MELSSRDNKAERRLNPQGLNYPKYLSYANGAAQYTLFKKESVRSYLENQQEPYRLVRFAIPFSHSPKCTVLRWRRYKKTQVYTIQNRPQIKNDRKSTSTKLNVTRTFSIDPSTSTLALDTSHLIITQFRTAEINKDNRISDRLSEVLEAAKEVVVRQWLQEGEVLDEMVMALEQNLSGEYYFTDLVTLKVADLPLEFTEKPLLKPSGLSITQLLQKQEELSSRIQQKPIPRLNSIDLQEAKTKPPVIPIKRPPGLNRRNTKKFISVPNPQEQQVSSIARHELQQVADNMDDLLTKSKELKIAFGYVTKVRLKDYGVETVENIVARIAEGVSSDLRLAAYHPNKDSIPDTCASMMKQVLMAGTSDYMKKKAEEVHQRLGITEFNYSLYAGKVETALREELVAEPDIDTMMEVLECLRPYIVNERPKFIEPVTISLRRGSNSSSN